MTAGVSWIKTKEESISDGVQGMDERMRAVLDIFLEKGIEVQAFICRGRLVMNPWDVKQCWIIEDEFVFSVFLDRNAEERIAAGMGSDGSVTTLGGFWVKRIERDEAVMKLITEIDGIKP